MGTDQQYAQLLHGRIDTINGQKTEAVAQALRPILAGANESWFRTQIVYYLPMPDVLHYFGIAEGDTIELGVELADSGIQTITMAPMHYEDYNPAKAPSVPTPLHQSRPEENYWFTYLEENNTMYLHYRKCAEMEDYSFSAFRKDFWRMVEEKRPDKLVVDIRDNRGGSSYIMDPLIRELKNSAWNRADQLYVIIGSDTYSAGVFNAASLRTKTDATFVGEATGGEPNHFGQVKQFELPNSKIIVRYSTRYFRLLDEDVNTLEPDKVIEESFASYREGADPVLAWILEQT